LETVLDYDAATISFLDGRTLVTAAARTSPVEDKETPFSLTANDYAAFEQSVRERRPLVIWDTHREPYSLDEGMRSWMIAPLLVGEEVIGQLTVSRRASGRYSERDAELLSSFVAHAAIALANARRSQEEKGRIEALEFQGKQLRILLENLRDLGADLDLPVLFRQVMAKAVETIPDAQTGLLFVQDEGRFVCKGAAGYEANLLGGVSVPLDSLLVDAEKVDKVVCVHDLGAWRERLPAELRELLERERPAQRVAVTMSAPIYLAEKLIGVLNLENWSSATAFEGIAREIARLFAAQAAIAIANAYLYRMVHEYAITLETRVEERTAEIRRAKERSEAILRSVADGVIVTDLEGNIVEANPVAEAWLNFRDGEKTLPNTGLRKFIRNVSAEHRNLASSIIEFPIYRQIAEGSPDELVQYRDLDCPFCQSAGPCWSYYEVSEESPPSENGAEERCRRCAYYAKYPTVVLQAHAAIIAGEEQPAGRVIVLRDISRLRELDRLKSQFVSNVSHELRTPLSNIKLYLSLLQKGRPERQTQYLRILDEEVNRLSGLIEDLLDLSRLETGGRPVVREAQYWDEIIWQVLGTYRPQFESKGLLLTTKLPHDVPPVHADRNQMIQVLTNLLSNALNYTQPGGRVWIRTGRWDNGEQEYVLLTVQDTGIGISAKDQEHIFDRFYRGRAETLGIPGTGLGLTIVKEIVESHGGYVTVKSEEGKGSKFTVYLPAYRGPDNSRGAAPGAGGES